MLQELKIGSKLIDKEALLVFPVAVFIIGGFPPLLELSGINSPEIEIVSAAFAAAITAVEMLRVRTKIAKSANRYGFDSSVLE